MVATGQTVFEGERLDEFKAHILGVLRNVIGPRRNLILARLEGGPLAKTGVIAGMSGSPVYIDGRLVGAVSYSLGQFQTEPIAGITPIEEMIEAATLPAPRRQAAALDLQMPLTQAGLQSSLKQAFAWDAPFADSPSDVHVFGDPSLNASPRHVVMRQIRTAAPMTASCAEIARWRGVPRSGFVPRMGRAPARSARRKSPARKNEPLRPGDRSACR
jgi:hypothetical protein